ncbi:MAG: dehydrogenase [Gammaproteobacteria bacterium CG11_big_fil_rev_8_21_14_0_20_46_22]|nr:MAG: dehydrogenase [Gammaproteobacteria bacterium CG12_big_fil_rev_8_21_14_0_65_46_12]PIR12138.1 MAG: dehydrogenase [Gammaproteobacteria bacterium CG11_big_fil_rev_8_21_14_0_20_46_22]
MLQLLQSLKDGRLDVATAPSPAPSKGSLTIQSSVSLISAGTERMLVDFGRASLLGKVKQQPEKVKEVLQKVKTDGLLTTIDAVKSKLEQPIPLGYCNVGRVVDTGDVPAFSVGDRVLSNGPHAEIVRVPKNLCVKIPDSVSDEEAVFGVVGAIALQGVRLIEPTIGECVVVQGLGLIGLMAVQILMANGCRVLGVDFDPKKLELARAFGAETVDLSAGEDLLAKAACFSRGQGVDAVLITASAQTNDIVRDAAHISRKRGRIVLVGVVGLELNRADFYEKELSFQVSCSYGPGRYDENYETRGHDYPLPFVRWTEQRNFEAVLDLMAAGKLDVKPLISAQFSIEDAAKAYQALQDKQHLGLLLTYPQTESAEALSRTVSLIGSPAVVAAVKPCVAFVGSGNYASRMLIPAFKKAGVRLHTILSSLGVSSVIHGKRLGFEKASTDIESVLANTEINTVAIATRHNLHASQTLAALKAGKHVFVEKPLCLNLDELEELQAAYEALCAKPKAPMLMVGFNRRFSPHVQKIKALLAPMASPKHIVMTVNAGVIPKEHWTQDLKLGGGRLIGEGCHFIDLLRYLADSPIAKADIVALNDAQGVVINDCFTVTLSFENGSCGVLHYLANGAKSVSKERLEIFIDGKILQLDNFRALKTFGFKRSHQLKLFRQDKGQTACAKAFVEAIEQGLAPVIPPSELFEVAKVCIDLQEQLER